MKVSGICHFNSRPLVNQSVAVTDTVFTILNNIFLLQTVKLPQPSTSIEPVAPLAGLKRDLTGPRVEFLVLPDHQLLVPDK